MSRASAAVRTIRLSLVGLGLVLPVLSLIPLGSYWLWERGFLLYWALGACVTTLLAWALSRWLLRPDPDVLQRAAVEAGGTVDPAWTPAENAAWARVTALAQEIDPARLTTREEIVALGQRVIETVALSLHPDRKSPLLQFTAPEALSLMERVSGRMNQFVRENVPLGDRLTLAQLKALYEWKGAIDVYEQAWSVWRVIRMINPATALANEVRERLSKELMAWGKDHVARRLATVYVEEVGRAAIDLYGGRLRVSRAVLEGHVSGDSRADVAEADQPLAEPLRMLVAGQVSAGKSSLVNALGNEVRAAVDALPATNRFAAYRLTREGLPAAVITDSPGLEAGSAPSAALIEEAQRTDLLLWVAPANRADREPDRAALEAIRAAFRARADRRPPVMLLVLTHVDRLRPFQEWKPPYDLGEASNVKAQSIRAAVEAAAAELGFSEADVVPVSLATGVAPYNIDALWAAIAERLPDAQRARLVRTLRDAEGAWDVGRLWGQVVGGGRVIFDALKPKR